MKGIGFWMLAALLAGCATTDENTAKALGRKYWRTKAEQDRAAWMEALDREGHNFNSHYKATMGPRGVYKFNRESRLAYFVINEKIAKTRGLDSMTAQTADGPLHFEWILLSDGTVDYHYSAPTNWDVFVSAHGEKGKCNPIKEANIHFGTAMPSEGPLALEMAHHREAWKAGPYADIPFPTNEIAAANNFIFGFRDGFRRLGFAAEGSFYGQLYFCTFDSNFPGGHTDFPPHFHISVNCRDGAQLHHFYVRPEDGRVTSDCYQDMSNVVDVWDRAVTFKPGDEFPGYDGHGRVAFRVKMLEDGTGFEFSTADRSRRVRVASPAPKDYVDVQLPEGDGWKTVNHIQVVDLPDEGVMRTPEGEVHYDPANGRKRD